MSGRNIAKAPSLQMRSSSSPCIFISYRSRGAGAAGAVASYLMHSLECDVYYSDNDARLKDAVFTGNHKEIVTSIDRALMACSHLLTIVSNHTKGSWWVPYEFGASRINHRVIALLLLEEVTELPSFMKIAEILRDSYDLDKWGRSSLRVLKESAATRPQIPGVPQFRGADPKYT